MASATWSTWPHLLRWGQVGNGFGTKWPLGPLARGASGFGYLVHLATLAQVGASGQVASGPSGHLVHLLGGQVASATWSTWPHLLRWGQVGNGFGTKWPLGPLARGASGFGHLAHLATLAQVGASGQVASGPSGHLVHLPGGQVASATWSTWPHLRGEVGKWLRDQVATWSTC